MNYEAEAREVIQINKINLPVLPTDISFFSTNDTIEESYIRAPGAFAFRSKHSRSVLNLMLTLPIMDLGVPRIYSEAEVELGVKGNQLITSLDAYPFCFIRSNRIKAYLGSHNFINEDKDPTMQSEYVSDMEGNELMMFGVQKITLSVDSRASNLLILELDLLYCNHKSLTTAIDISEGVLLAEPPSKLTSYKQALKGSQFDKGDNTMRADSTEMPGYTALMQKLSEGNIAKAELLLRETSAVAAWDNMSSKVGYTQASIKIPKFINMFELGASLKAEVNPKSRKLSENDFNVINDSLSYGVS